MRFAHLKVQPSFERMRPRGLAGARDEFHLAAIVRKLKTMAQRLLGAANGWGVRVDWVSGAWQSGRGIRRPGGDAQPEAGPKRFLNGNANCGRAFFSTASVKMRRTQPEQIQSAMPR
jgi:hypothetical protein